MFTSRLTSATVPVAAPVTTAPPAEASLSGRISSREQAWWLVFIAIHAPLGLWMQAQSMVVFFQGAATMLVGVWWTLNSARPERVAYVAAYMVGSEVLWRMVTDALPWESAKYGMVVLFSGALLNRHGITSLLAPALWFGLLLPSISITTNEVTPEALRGILSFNLSGPLALVVAAAFFWRLQLTSAHVLRLFLLLIAPAVAIGSIVVNNIVTAEHITFTFESNHATSGGFGPNQVSQALGLGALVCFWCQLDRQVNWLMRIVLFMLMVWLFAQCALTFSRGGMLGALLAAAVAVTFLILDADARRKMVLVVPLVLALSYYVVWPALVGFTGGNLAVRYSDTSLTHRDELGNADLELFMSNPVLGVGPGLSTRRHRGTVATHTEFTRVLAEHGFFGAIYIGVMLWLGAFKVFKAPTAREKALVASAVAWSMLFMLNAAMRTVAPSFMFGLGCCAFAAQASLSRRAAASPDAAPRGPRRTIIGQRPSAA